MGKPRVKKMIVGEWYSNGTARTRTSYGSIFLTHRSYEVTVVDFIEAMSKFDPAAVIDACAVDDNGNQYITISKHETEQLTVEEKLEYVRAMEQLASIKAKANKHLEAQQKAFKATILEPTKENLLNIVRNQPITWMTPEQITDVELLITDGTISSFRDLADIGIRHPGYNLVKMTKAYEELITKGNHKVHDAKKVTEG